ncbi:aldehyde dehydrogenase [Novosphingobium sp. ERN07]|uniref:aldehyde dehydrogenase family protein n=1 Tax=Novosphingobium sp. ERN07 TaxID=2726187 RepID=UPI0014570034|nr:aldehyde dehydrogenase family protein [Novosphingobium sp. ERN07]NLR72829.1 aldehyde dehydrogenase [Novosphingobium sp. ERN07]
MNVLLENSRPVIGTARPSETSLGARDHVNPATGCAQAKVLVCGADEIEAAAIAAIAGQRAWIGLGAEARRAALMKLADLVEAEGDTFATLAALECGNPVSTPANSLALSWIRYYAGWADKIEGGYSEPIGMAGFAYNRHEPYGVVGAIIPWNSPIVAIAMKVVPALAAGNAVILKPPTITPFVAIRIGELALEAGVPPGALCVVPGDAEAGEALIDHPAVGKVSFTGGGVVAKSVMHRCADQLKPLALELGGKSANIICADADLEKAAMMAAAWSLVPLAGQGCVLPTRVYAQAAIYDELVDRVRTIGASFRQGDPLDPETLIGPVINEAAAQRIIGVIERAKAESGGSVVLGGRRGQGDLAAGAYVEPTIFAGVAHDSHLAREEVFGPVLAIVRFGEDKDAVAMANDSRFGLGAYVHTRDLSRAHRMASELEAGGVGVNGMLPMAPNQPFGGYKTSGFGREGGRQGLEEFLQIKQVVVHL